VEWLKVKDLNSNPSTEKKKKAIIELGYRGKVCEDGQKWKRLDSCGGHEIMDRTSDRKKTLLAQSSNSYMVCGAQFWEQHYIFPFGHAQNKLIQRIVGNPHLEQRRENYTESSPL
jgi:hypothetical protein